MRRTWWPGEWLLLAATRFLRPALNLLPRKSESRNAAVDGCIVSHKTGAHHRVHNQLRSYHLAAGALIVFNWRQDRISRCTALVV
jgi:hypothetical protein